MTHAGCRSIFQKSTDKAVIFGAPWPIYVHTNRERAVGDRQCRSDSRVSRLPGLQAAEDDDGPGGRQVPEDVSVVRLAVCRETRVSVEFRDRRPGTLDVHPTANALILNYELEVTVLGEKEHVLYGEKAVSVTQGIC